MTSPPTQARTANEQRIASLECLVESFRKMNASDFLKLKAWVADPNRNPAQIAFTAGVGRDTATAVEDSGLFAQVVTMREALELTESEIDQSTAEGLLTVAAIHAAISSSTDYANKVVVDRDDLTKIRGTLVNCAVALKDHSFIYIIDDSIVRLDAIRKGGGE